MRAKAPSYLSFTCTLVLPLLRHLRAGVSWGPVPWSDLSVMMGPVQGKVALKLCPSYVTMASADASSYNASLEIDRLWLICLHSFLYKGTLNKGNIHPQLKMLAKKHLCAYMACVPKVAHTPPHTHGTPCKQQRGGTQTSSYPCAYMACTPGGTHASSHITSCTYGLCARRSAHTSSDT
jgi:hypothetical protein